MYQGLERFASDWSCFEISMVKPKLWAVCKCKEACAGIVLVNFSNLGQTV